MAMFCPTSTFAHTRMILVKFFVNLCLFVKVINAGDGIHCGNLAETNETFFSPFFAVNDSYYGSYWMTINYTTDTCEIYCDGKGSCSDKPINCGSLTNCILTCSEGGSCDNVTINALNTKYFYIELNAIRDNYIYQSAIEGGVLYCPFSDANKKCEIHCNHYGYDVGCDDWTIYATEGMNDIKINQFQLDMMKNVVIWCGWLYKHNCTYGM